jgi:hypothetical protein
MAINRALMNRQMYNMGGPSLQAGAPDITLTGDVRPTYSAMRKQRMAYGGIAGLDGRKKYGIGSWFQENIMDPIKENPVTSAVIGGGLLNQFGLPDFLPDVGVFDDDFGQNFLGNILGKVVPGDTEFNTVLGDDNPFIMGGGVGGGYTFPTSSTLGNLGDLATGNNPLNLSDLYQAATGGTDTSNMTNDQKAQLQLEQYKRRNLNADFIKAMGIGTAAGAYVDSQPKDTLPTDKTGINFQTAQQVMDDPNQRFKPPVEATQLAANGGRIGYANGTPDPVMPENFLNDVDKIIEAYMKSQEGMYFLRDEISRGKSMEQIINQMKKELEQQNPSSMEDMDPGFTIPGPPRSPNATPIPEGMMINPRKTMEFRDVNQNGIPDRDEGIYSQDRDFVPKKDSPNMDTGFTIPRTTRAGGGRIGFSEGSKDYNEDPEYRGWKTMYEKNKSIGEMHEKHSEYLNFYNSQGKAEGGLMDLGGMEKDYREDGGFVPIGGQEKADDVPARLSKNEFVFTADAVRNAGGGDIDQGAQVMEKLMKNLESGGQVSEESQGLDGAREMFETSQRLEKRII